MGWLWLELGFGKLLVAITTLALAAAALAPVAAVLAQPAAVDAATRFGRLSV